ncbi:hypothetical protein GCM10023259_067240 [Thermocatellispora tengchongensis]|uniref:cytochrome d ubiquinol oxidase subunit II n=1 Tax=Thermocatellispora tengchongensis TaxID=1073253 RepID=UPI0031EE97F7
MDILWYAVLALLLAGYFALEGFDIGAGMLLPVLGGGAGASGRPGRDRIVAAMAPFVLANEVWLIAAAGVLFGAFPALEGEVLSGLYWAVVALLVSWIVRDAGLWFRRRAGGAAWRAFWDGALCLGSWGLAVTWGFALAGIAGGLAGPPLGVLGGLLYAAAVAAVLAHHGRTFASWRGALPGRPPRTGRALAGSALLAALPALGPLLAAAPGVLGHAADPGTLGTLALTVGPFAPLVVAAQVWVWRTFGSTRATSSTSFF